MAIPFTLFVYAVPANGFRPRRTRWAGVGLVVLIGTWFVTLATGAQTLRAYPILVALAMLLTLPLSVLLGDFLELGGSSRTTAKRSALLITPRWSTAAEN